MINKVLITLEYVRKNSLKFLSFLVALSMCSAMKYAAIGKYATMLQESTQVVAGESFFSSNFLKQVESEGAITKSESETRLQNGENSTFTFTIATWNKYSYTIPVEVKNYNNALKYNEDDCQNIYFYVKSSVYLDPECQQPATDLEEDLELKTSVSFPGESSGTVALGNLQIKSYGKVGSITIGGVNYPVSFLKGGTKQTQKVNITVATRDEETLVEEDALYVRISAHMIPVTSLSSISLIPRADGGVINYNTTASTSGIFYTMLGGLFTLGSHSATAEITCSAINDEDSMRVVLKIACDAMEYQSSAKARVYYRSDKLECGEDAYTSADVNDSASIQERTKFFTDNFITGTTTVEQSNEILSNAAIYDKYIEFVIQTGNLKELIFLKDTQDDFQNDYYKFGVFKDEE